MNLIKAICSVFAAPDLVSLARKELYQAERDRMASQSALEAHEAIIQANSKRIARLEKFLSTQPLEGSSNGQN